MHVMVSLVASLRYWVFPTAGTLVCKPLRLQVLRPLILLAGSPVLKFS